MAILILSMPVTKVWQLIAKHLDRPLYRYGNPLVYLTVVVPQLAYLSVWRRSRLERLSYFTTGYVTVLEKPYDLSG
ncbi:MAG: hypothetical protein H0W37_13100 [Pseudonocardiales bacterium]|nr:hypothetical protein [Pseudonocardiales bacterium]